MSPMVLFEAVWLESPASQSGLLFFGALARVWDTDSPEGRWERSWEALLEALGKADLQRPQKRPKHGGVSTVCELACTGQGGEALPSPLRDPLFLTCARAVSPRPAFGVCCLTAATPHLV